MKFQILDSQVISSLNDIYLYQLDKQRLLETQNNCLFGIQLQECKISRHYLFNRTKTLDIYAIAIDRLWHRASIPWNSMFCPVEEEGLVCYGADTSFYKLIFDTKTFEYTRVEVGIDPSLVSRTLDLKVGHCYYLLTKQQLIGYKDRILWTFQLPDLVTDWLTVEQDVVLLFENRKLYYVSNGVLIQQWQDVQVVKYENKHLKIGRADLSLQEILLPTTEEKIPTMLYRAQEVLVSHLQSLIDQEMQLVRHVLHLTQET